MYRKQRQRWRRSRLQRSGGPVDLALRTFRHCAQLRTPFSRAPPSPRKKGARLGWAWVRNHGSKDPRGRPNSSWDTDDTRDVFGTTCSFGIRDDDFRFGILRWINYASASEQQTRRPYKLHRQYYITHHLPLLSCHSSLEPPVVCVVVYAVRDVQRRFSDDRHGKVFQRAFQNIRVFSPLCFGSFH